MQVVITPTTIHTVALCWTLPQAEHDPCLQPLGLINRISVLAPHKHEFKAWDARLGERKYITLTVIAPTYGQSDPTVFSRVVGSILLDDNRDSNR